MQIVDDRADELIFQKWDESHGFWTIEDHKGCPQVVRYFEAEQHYRVYLGDEDQLYATDPIAWPMHSRETSHRDGEKRSGRSSGARQLRGRKVEQMNPFTAEKITYRRQKQGKSTQSSDLERSIPVASQRPGKRKSESTPECKKEKSNSRRTSVETLVTLKTDKSISATSSIITEEKLSATVLYVHLRDETPTPLYLNCTSEHFFEKIDAAWGLGSRTYHLELSIPWKSQFGRMTLRRGLEDTWNNLFENVRRSPCWKRGDACEIDATICLQWHD